MPQLNPYPWFPIFLFTWLFFLILMPNKVTTFLFNNHLTTKSTQKPKLDSWTWPWP